MSPAIRTASTSYCRTMPTISSRTALCSRSRLWPFRVLPRCQSEVCRNLTCGSFQQMSRRDPVRVEVVHDDLVGRPSVRELDRLMQVDRLAGRVHVEQFPDAGPPDDDARLPV